MSVSIAEKVFLGIAVLGFLGIAIWIAVALYFAYTKMDIMLDHLKNCPAIMIRTVLLDSGAWGRLHVLGVIMGLMVHPDVYLRDGGAITTDLDNFPSQLKRKLIVLQWCGWTLLLLMFSAGIVLYSGFV